jgi:hypothetical protein
MFGTRVVAALKCIDLVVAESLHVQHVWHVGASYGFFHVQSSVDMSSRVCLLCGQVVECVIDAFWAVAVRRSRANACVLVNRPRRVCFFCFCFLLVCGVVS